MALRARFTEHPASVGETYGQHFKVAVHFSAQLAKASVAALWHAVYPCACTTKASDTIRCLHDEMTGGPRGEAAAARQRVAAES